MLLAFGAFQTSHSVGRIFLKLLASQNGHSYSVIDLRFKRILWQLIGGTRGGLNRVRLLEALSNLPGNANQLAERLKLDYKTVSHHLRILELNGLIEPSQGGSYARMYFLTPWLQENLAVLREILARIGSK